MAKLHKHWICMLCNKPCLSHRGMIGTLISDCCGAPAKTKEELGR